MEDNIPPLYTITKELDEFIDGSNSRLSVTAPYLGSGTLSIARKLIEERNRKHATFDVKDIPTTRNTDIVGSAVRSGLSPQDGDFLIVTTRGDDPDNHPVIRDALLDWGRNGGRTIIVRISNL